MKKIIWLFLFFIACFNTNLIFSIETNTSSPFMDRANDSRFNNNVNRDIRSSNIDTNTQRKDITRNPRDPSFERTDRSTATDASTSFSNPK